MRYHLPTCMLVALVSMAISYVELCQILVKIYCNTFAILHLNSHPLLLKMLAKTWQNRILQDAHRNKVD